MDELLDLDPQLSDSEAHRLSSSRRQEILASLREERDKRRALISQGQKYVIDHTDLTPVQSSTSIRSDTIAKLISERRGKDSFPQELFSADSARKGDIYEEVSPEAMPESPMEIGNEGEMWDFQPAEPRETREDGENPHQDQMQPDFRHLANIYGAYKDVPETVPKPTKRVNPAPRTSSAPPTRLKKTKDDLRKEAEARVLAECTFRPKITPMPRGKDFGYSEKATPGDKFTRLSRPKTDVIQKREKQKRDNEEQMLAECVFKPKINANSRGTGVDVSERLYREADNRVAEREQIEEEQVSLYAFQPQVQASTSILVGRLAERPPIYKRVGEVQREKQETLQRLRISSEKNDPNLTFKPTLNSRSVRLAEQKQVADGEAHLSISEKLAKDAQDKVQRQLQRAELQEQSELLRYSFEPQISVGSNESVRGGFFERQKLLMERQKVKKNEMLAKAGGADHCTFKPQVDRTSSIIVESMPERAGETESARVRRLYTGATATKGQSKAKAEKELYSEVTFEPQINPISKTLGRSASLSELAYNISKAQGKKMQAEQRAAEVERICTFQPQLFRSDQFSHVGSSYGQGQDVLKKIQEEEHDKQLKLGEMKKMKEFEEMKTCTFQPEMNDPRGDTEMSVESVKGLDRFLQLKDLARKQEEERRLREEQVFRTNPKGHVSEVPYTVPQPFNLHPSMRQQKLERAQREALEKQKTECTFQPQTMELRNRQMIQKMLENEI